MGTKHPLANAINFLRGAVRGIGQYLTDNPELADSTAKKHMRNVAAAIKWLDDMRERDNYLKRLEKDGKR